MRRNVDQLVRQFNDRIQHVALDGYILQGSVVRRHLTHTTAKGKKEYGPYYLWTRKRQGKTVSIALDKEQAHLIRDAIGRQRALDRRLAELRALSEQIIRVITTGVTTRNHPK